jgi:exosortase A-associated hydrolase 2
MSDVDPDIRFEPFFLASGSMRLFCVYFPPVSDVRGSYVFVPPFAEEMNRSRSMVAMQSRVLAANGFGVLLVDLFGTGDSSGQFGEATWSSWKASALAGYEWLDDRSGRTPGILALRLGAVLAAQLLDERAIAADHAVFWQPVTNSKSMLTQFLRIKVAAAMDLKLQPPSTDDMRNAFKAGQSVEVAGYEVNPELALALDAADWADLAGFGGTSIDWLEVSPNENPVLSGSSTKTVGALRQRGAKITSTVCQGPPFWQLHERTMAPQLISSTTAQVLQHHG